MKLRVTQKNLLFEIIEAHKIPPTYFNFREITEGFAGPVLSTIELKESNFYFKLMQGSNGINLEYCPGQITYTEENRAKTWEGVVPLFYQWLQITEDEILVEDYWERFEKSINSSQVQVTDNLINDKFSVSEFLDLQKKVIKLKDGFKTLELSAVQVDTLNQKLDQLLKHATDLGKVDWRNLFIGSFVTVIVQLSLSQNEGRAIWELIRQTFNNLFLYP